MAVCRARQTIYPYQAPFHPPERYPELAFLPVFHPDAENHVYAAVRDALALLTGTQPGPDWNPLAGLIKPGDTVALKPNFIKECHETKPTQWQQVITHGSVIRAVCDYVLRALNGVGRVVICDAPQTDSSFDEICRVSATRAVVEWYQSWSDVPVELLDLRSEEWQTTDGVVVNRQKLAGDPAGYVAVNLGADSAFHGIQPAHGFYGADYDTAATNSHHHGDRHEYLLSRTVMDADVVINVPKLKTHKKTGITCALKNLVGINGDKNWLPHYVMGDPAHGGDQFPAGTWKTRAERTLVSRLKWLLHLAPAWMGHVVRPLKKVGRRVFGDTHAVVRSGNWHGNDTAWRMTLDLNKCLLCRAAGSGGQRSVGGGRKPCGRRYLTIVDAIIAGEGEGPLAPDAKECGLIMAGRNPVAVDTACAWLMGFDARKLRLLAGAYADMRLPLQAFAMDDVTLVSNERAWNGRVGSLDPATTFHFVPHFGWKGAIERSPG